MARTRGKQAELEQQGIPPTPPQQLATPRRITKAKTRQARATADAQSAEAQSTDTTAQLPTGANTRARPTRATRAATSKQIPKKRGRKPKARTQKEDIESELAVAPADASTESMAEDPPGSTEKGELLKSETLPITPVMVPPRSPNWLPPYYARGRLRP